MKRAIATALSLLAVTPLAACSGGSYTDSKQTPNSQDRVEEEARQMVDEAKQEYRQQNAPLFQPSNSGPPPKIEGFTP